jgi:cytochrome c6
MKSKIIILLFFVSLQASAQKDRTSGKAIFESKCAWCHGKDGAKGMLGAKNLRKSTLADADYFAIISNGKNVMPTWKKRLSGEQITLIINYIKQFRNP